jgi:hypothetical protein
MSVVSTAASAIAANHALNVQAMKMAALRQEKHAAESIVNMLEQAIEPATGSDGSKAVDIKV